MAVMSNFDPMTYDFTRREALLVRRAFHKKFGLGLSISAGENLMAARRLEAAKLVTVETAAKGPKLVVRLTRLGREAWINQGLRAAGKPLVRLA
jgi:hypothetical protein